MWCQGLHQAISVASCCVLRCMRKSQRHRRGGARRKAHRTSPRTSDRCVRQTSWRHPHKVDTSMQRQHVVGMPHSSAWSSSSSSENSPDKARDAFHMRCVSRVVHTGRLNVMASSLEIFHVIVNGVVPRPSAGGFPRQVIRCHYVVPHVMVHSTRVNVSPEHAEICALPSHAAIRHGAILAHTSHECKDVFCV